MKKKCLEVEVRSFIDKKAYEQILSKLKSSAVFVSEINEETIYFSAKKDLRLRRNEKEAFLILKEGSLHDNHRKEYEIKFADSEFDNMTDLLQSLGHKVQIKWFRKRLVFKKGVVKLLLDDTKGYGKIFETEMMVGSGNEERALIKLKKIFKNYGIAITSKEKFDKAFEYYKKNWKTLTK